MIFLVNSQSVTDLQYLMGFGSKSTLAETRAQKKEVYDVAGYHWLEIEIGGKKCMTWQQSIRRR